MASAPVNLDTIYVTVEKGLLEKVDAVQNKFGGGFQNQAKKRGAGDISTPKSEERMKAIVRESLGRLSMIHTGDVFHLPLPPHPITHARPPPAIAIECEPVSQGRVTAKTKIVLIQSGVSQEKAIQKMAPSQPIIEESLEDTAEDTSNDQFFSAAEDKDTTTGSEAEGDMDISDTEDSDQEHSDEDSDSMEDMISLSAPGLPAQQAGTLSAMTSATPRPGDRRTGVHTPGSVYSTFSAATARTGARPGKVFRTEPLLRRVPTELLHPKPSEADDDDAFVFVDTSTLAKISCFSGDWVRIEVSKNATVNGFAIASFAALRTGDEEGDWRAVRIFGMAAIQDQKARYAVDKTGDRRSSFSGHTSLTSFTPKIYVSPTLLANLSNAQYVKIGALPKGARHHVRDRPATSRSPPFAKDVKLLKLSTPLTTRADLQSTLFANLQRFFEGRRRVVKRGDLIAISVDAELGKLMLSSGGDTDKMTEELTKGLQSSGQRTNRSAIAWFYVQFVSPERENNDELDNEESWGGVAIVDHQTVRLNMSAETRPQPISDSTEVWTQYWLGMRSVPQQNAYRPDILVTPTALPPLERLPLERKLSGLIAASTSTRAINLGLPPAAILLHSNQRQVGKTYTANSACSSVGVYTYTISGHALLSENASTTGGGDVKTEGMLKARAEIALSCGPQQTALLIQHIDVLTAARMQPTLRDIIGQSRVLIATTSKIDDIPDGIRSLFTHEFEIAAPDETARESILRNACTSTSVPLLPSVSLKSVALQTAALVAGDLIDVVNRACLARSRRLLDLATTQSLRLTDVLIAGGQATTHLLPTDFTAAVAAARSTFSDAIGAPKIPTVTWDDVGGLASQKDAIIETISLPLTRPELFANGVRKRSGILFYGPPGTGKTLLAKAIATEFSLNFFSVKGPELLNMYIGESEANVRRVFQRARDARPCVVFFDELDSVAPKRGNQGDSGGVMDRIVSQLLAELDGMSSSSPQDAEGESPSSTSSGSGVFVIGATNRPDLLDSALLRPGRFDKMLYLGVADSHDQQVTILRALTRKFNLGPDVDLSRVATRLPFTYTGADLYALCSDAMLKAITRQTQAVDRKVAEISKQRAEQISVGYFFDHLAQPSDTDVTVTEEDFDASQEELVGSVSAKELEHFQRVKKLFESQDISAETQSQSKTQTTLPLRNDQSKGKLQRPTSPVAKFAYPGQSFPFTSRPTHPTTQSKPQQSTTNSTTATHNSSKPKPPFQPARKHSLRTRIGNPDSGASSSDDGMQRLDPMAMGMYSDADADADGEMNGDADASAAGESDFGVSSKGFTTANGTVNGKGKMPAGRGFHSDIGEEDGIYD